LLCTTTRSPTRLIGGNARAVRDNSAVLMFQNPYLNSPFFAS
jgi:hypothetical protein